MGITGELVRNVFSKNKSFPRHNTHGIRRNSVERKRSRGASHVLRSYICGDELNSSLQMEDHSAISAGSSIVAEVDFTSFRNNRATNVISSGRESDSVITSVCAEEDTASEATVNQPLYDLPKDENDRKEKHNSTHKLFQQEDAAVIIQSAFRSFRARRTRNVAKLEDHEKPEASGSPSRESIGTSIEVQTGNSSDIFSIKEESFDLRPPMRHRTRPQILKLQEDWDDSTVSSVISKMRMQHRLEAATRRERALAYAFSQQLRICSKKRQSITKSNETNMGWSWLERWMAARQHESIMTDDEIASSQKTVVRKIMLDSSFEEKESCGSNEVSSLVEVNILSVPRNIPLPSKVRSKANRKLSRQNSTSSHLCPRDSKDVKKVCHVEDEKEKWKRAKQPAGHRRDIKHNDAITQGSLEYQTPH